MTESQERAKVLAGQIQRTMREIKLAEQRLKQLSRELTQALAQARAETEAALTIVEYSSGRYECAACGHGTLFTEPVRGELPACDNCGQRRWAGHEPTVTKVQPPPPKRFPAGMYECTRCGGRTVVATDTDELSACELCGADEFSAIEM